MEVPDLSFLTSLFSTMISFILIYCLHFTHIVSAYDLNAFQIKYGLFIRQLIKHKGFAFLVLVVARSLCITTCPLKSVFKSNYVSAITRTCHLTVCLDVHIWCVFQIINLILELKVKVKLRQNL